MKKLVLAIVSNMLMIILPLLAKPHLIFHYKILILIIGGICVWLTQPPVSVDETNTKKDSDRFSVILILVMSLVSVVAPVVEWAYFIEVQPGLTWFTVGGIAMLITGIVFRAWAVTTLGDFFTATVQIKDNHRLITDGPYSIVRHPSYTGAFLAITGSAVVLQSWVGLSIAIICMTVAYYVRISIEEKELSDHFGNDYVDYKKSTRRIIPFVW